MALLFFPGVYVFPMVCVSLSVCVSVHGCVCMCVCVSVCVFLFCVVSGVLGLGLAISRSLYSSFPVYLWLDVRYHFSSSSILHFVMQQSEFFTSTSFFLLVFDLISSILYFEELPDPFSCCGVLCELYCVVSVVYKMIIY